MNNLKRKLTSRKMWASVANFVSMLLVFFNYPESTATQVAALIMAGAGVIGYVIAEGLADSTPNTNTDATEDQIMIEIIVAILTLLGVIVTNIGSNRKIEHSLETSQAVTDCKIEELTREVREHNNFARRMPVVEEQIKVINHRIKDLEGENNG